VRIKKTWMEDTQKSYRYDLKSLIFTNIKIKSPEKYLNSYQLIPIHYRSQFLNYMSEFPDWIAFCI